MSATIIGIDPGATTGLVVRHGTELLAHKTTAGIDGVLDAVVDALEECGLRGLWVAIEDVTPPNPHMGIINVSGIITTAKVFGAVLGAYPDAIVVPPAGHGSGPLGAYPQALRPTRGKGAGKDKLRHCRSAWDIAGAARTLLRVGAA